MQKLLVVVLVALALGTGMAWAEGDPAAGKEKASTKGCVACHGLDGISSVPTWPNLAGQHEQYLAISLRAYRANERKNSNAATMMPMAAGLSDQDIADLAAYYASL